MIDNSLIPIPSLILLVGAALTGVLHRRLRPYSVVAFAVCTLILAWTLPNDAACKVGFLDHEIVLFQTDQLSRIFGTIFAFISVAGGIFGFDVTKGGEHAAALCYAAGAVGVTFAGDFISLFAFWELMAVASTYLVWARNTAESSRAGTRYLLVHLFGGTILLAGIILVATETGSILLSAAGSAQGSGLWLILGGVALNAAIPPLHAWLTDAYPKATVAGAVFMSALTTKSAVYVLARLFPGWEILVILGTIMALYGVVYAVLANDIREILAYHIISQVGYMVVGIGIGTQLALNGAVAHAFSHILYKALLFMGAGVVLFATGKSKLTELGGLARSMPLTLWLYMIGAFSISGFPLFNGFISKSMVVAAAGESHLDAVYLLLTLASVGTFLHTGLKLPYFTWYSSDAGLAPGRVPRTMHGAMAIVAFFCILFGIAPGLLYDHLPFSTPYEPYTIPHLTESVQILVLTFVAFWMFRGKLAGESLLALDTDWFYRRSAEPTKRYILGTIESVFDVAERTALLVVHRLVTLSANPVVLVNKSFSGKAFDPNRARPSLGVALGLLLLLVVIVVVLNLSRV
jgi:multicomponent Na+:H+ antiporter subunit D